MHRLLLFSGDITIFSVSKRTVTFDWFSRTLFKRSTSIFDLCMILSSVCLLPPTLYSWVSVQGAVPCEPCCLLQVRQVQSDFVQLAVACPRNTAHVKQYNSRLVTSSNCVCKVRNRLDLLEVFDVYPSLSLLDSDWQAGPIGSVSTQNSWQWEKDANLFSDLLQDWNRNLW